MPYQILEKSDGYKVCKANDLNKCFSNKPMTKEQAIKQMRAIIISEHLRGSGQVHYLSNLYNQLRDIDYDMNKYLRDVKKKAKQYGYNPKNLYFSDDNKHKFMIYDDNGYVHRFGRVNYGDYLIWSHLEKYNQVPTGYANMKKNVFHKSHEKIKGVWKSNPFSPNNLSLRLLW